MGGGENYQQMENLVQMATHHKYIYPNLPCPKAICDEVTRRKLFAKDKKGGEDDDDDDDEDEDDEDGESTKAKPPAQDAEDDDDDEDDDDIAPAPKREERQTQTQSGGQCGNV